MALQEETPPHPPRMLVAGNWKMNGLVSALAEIDALKSGLTHAAAVDVAIFPPATLLAKAAHCLTGSSIILGAQDAHAAPNGAFTGDLSAAMAKDAGAGMVILGHSERRERHQEMSADVKRKAAAALDHGLKPIICVGESLGERSFGLAAAVCRRQLTGSLPRASTGSNTVIAYEPVWAIGTGHVPTDADIEAMHQTLRETLLAREGGTDSRWRILYGGSVTSVNAGGLFSIPGVDGALVGGASLNAASFLAIIAAAEEAVRDQTYG